MQSADKLVTMANQIVRNLAVQGDDKAVALAADHMRRFWEPRMRRQIYQHLDAGAAGLTPMAKRAVEKLVQLETAPAS
jgi:formate dehydrogenase subunit delta